eukprot:g4233.t1
MPRSRYDFDDDRAFRSSTASRFGGNSGEEDKTFGSRSRHSMSRRLSSDRDRISDRNGQTRDRSRSRGGFGEGDKVEACFRDGNKFFPGKITRRREDGTYDIRYDDGESERRVRKSLIRYPSNYRSRRRSRSRRRNRSNFSESDESNDNIKEGDKVEADFGGKGKYYKGEITRSHYDGTFDIRYEDGDSERRVRRRYIRKRKKNRSSSQRSRYSRNSHSVSVSGSESDISLWKTDDDANVEEGDKIEANYGGKGKYYKGKITRAHYDDTFDILYEDGASERRVRRRNIKKKRRKKESRSSSRHITSTAESGSDDDLVTDDDADVEEGDKIEANYGGKGKYYKGKITRAHYDDTFDILYEDGASERRVRRRNIKKKRRKKESRSSSRHITSTAESGSDDDLVTDDDADVEEG